MTPARASGPALVLGLAAGEARVERKQTDPSLDLGEAEGAGRASWVGMPTRRSGLEPMRRGAHGGRNRVGRWARRTAWMGGRLRTRVTLFIFPERS